MGKLRYDPKHHHHYPHYHSKTQKVIKKPIKITYISSPLFVRACDASDFRSVVQQLTGKDSNDLIYESDLLNIDHSTLYNQVMQGDQGGEYLHATEEDGNYGSSYYYNRLMDYSLEFNQDYYWKEVAGSVLQSPIAMYFHEDNQSMIA